MLAVENLIDDIWQFPVILLPLTFGRGETIALRPITAIDAMTADFARLPMELIEKIGARLCEHDGIDAVIYDVSSKPPATIEWE